MPPEPSTGLAPPAGGWVPPAGVEPPPPPEESRALLAEDGQVAVVLVGVVDVVVVVVLVVVVEAEPQEARFVVSLLTTVRPAGVATFAGWVVVFESVVVCLVSCLVGLFALAAALCALGLTALVRGRGVMDRDGRDDERKTDAAGAGGRDIVTDGRAPSRGADLDRPGGDYRGDGEARDCLGGDRSDAGGNGPASTSGGHGRARGGSARAGSCPRPGGAGAGSGRAGSGRMAEMGEHQLLEHHERPKRQQCRERFVRLPQLDPERRAAVAVAKVAADKRSRGASSAPRPPRRARVEPPHRKGGGPRRPRRVIHARARAAT